ncbi:MAG TPA: hypothetical protein PKA61_08245 [Nitrospira sp.]|nr:hypothetical protein [Nitrospira sp.]
MKMLTIVCRERLEGAVVQVLNDVGVKGYTVMSGLGGKGLTGTVSEYSWMADRNVSFMVVLEDQQAAPIADALKQLYGKLLEHNSGKEVSLKVFLQPCEVIL